MNITRMIGRNWVVQFTLLVQGQLAMGMDTNMDTDMNMDMGRNIMAMAMERSIMHMLKEGNSIMNNIEMNNKTMAIMKVKDIKMREEMIITEMKAINYIKRIT
jgi:hypothetical protein